jgi:hypothetical protein
MVESKGSNLLYNILKYIMGSQIVNKQIGINIVKATVDIEK